MMFLSASVQWLILVTAAVCCYVNSLWCGFVFDDASAIKDNKDLRPETPMMNLVWNDFWGTPMNKERSHKSYRPLCVLTFRLNYMLSSLEPMTYHLVNVLLHAAVCLLFLKVCCRFMRPTTAFIAAMMFAIHPVHTEAVTGVVGRAELLSSLFYLAALMTYAKCCQADYLAWGHLLMTISLVAVAVLCKEQGITVVGVCCVYEIAIAQKMVPGDVISLLSQAVKAKPVLTHRLKLALIRSLCLILSTGCLLFARVKVMGAQLPVFTKFDNPAAVADTPARHLTLSYLLPVNTWLLLCPHWLCCDWTMGTLPLITSLFDFRNLITLVFYATAGCFLRRVWRQRGCRSRAIIMSLALMVLPFIPASNLFFPVGFVVAERVLYMPSMGFCMLVALGVELLVSHKQRLRLLVYSALSVMLLTHSLKTVVRNADWESEYILFQAALRVNHQNAKLFNNVGHALENDNNHQRALKFFQQAARVQPDDIGAHINVGRTLNHLKQFTEAEKVYRTALALMPPVIPGQSYTTRVAPNHLNVFLNLGNLIAKDESRLLEADSLYRTAITMRSDYVQAYINRGDVLMRLNRSSEAEDQYLTALHHDPENADIHYNLGVVLLEQHRHQEALRSFNNALKINPKHKQTLFNSAALMQELGDPKLRPEATKRLNELMEMEPENEKVYFNLGMLAMDAREFEKAREWFHQAVELKEDFRSALFNQALMLVNDLNKPMDALPYLQKLLKFYPSHTKGLILMGDLNINHLKDVDAAEQNFLAVLETEPSHVQATHNLCVVYVEKGEMYRAEKCLVAATQLAPGEEYIKQHLDIVRKRIMRYEQAKKKHEEEQHIKQHESSEDIHQHRGTSNKKVEDENTHKHSDGNS